MTTAQVEFTEAELLADHTIAEPLIAGGVRCHGGFDDDGTYVSPRTKHRVPAIEAWQAQHREPFGTEILHVPLETWPEHFPNVAQARHLIKAGVPEPLIATLTRIGTVEGFGANIRLAAARRHAAALRRGHPRHRDRPPRQGPVRGPRPRRGRLGGGGRPQGHVVRRPRHRLRGARPPRSTSRPCSPAWASASRAAPAASTLERALPDDIDVNLELIANLMIRVLLHRGAGVPHVRAGPRTWLSDPDLVAGDGEAADLVSLHPGRRDAARRLPQDRAHRDARPHLDRHRAARSTTGTEMIGTLWDRGLDAVARRRPELSPQGRPRRGRALVPAARRTARTSSPSSTRSPPTPRRPA